MILRSAFGLCVLTGLALGAAQAQPYPTYYPPANTQVYPPYRGPVPGATAPDDDDDDDLPPHLRAAPGNYPPPPGGYLRHDPPTTRAWRRRRAARGIARPGDAGPDYGGRGPSVVYGDRSQGLPPEAYPPAYRPAPGRGPVGSGQPESYGAAPQAGYAPREAAVPQQYPPYGANPPANQEQQPGPGPMQLGPVRASAGRSRRPGRHRNGTARNGRGASARGSARGRQGRASSAIQAPARDVPIARARRHARDRYGEHVSVSRARQRTGDALRHRRRPRRLHLGGRGTRLENVRVAGLASAGRDDRAPALSAALHGGRRRQSARRARALSRQDALPHPRHEPAFDDREVRFLGLYPADERRHPGSLQPRAGRHPRGRAAGPPPAQASNAPQQPAPVQQR